MAQGSAGDGAANKGLVLAHLAEFIDGELSPQLAAQVDGAVKAAGEDLPGRFKSMRGRLQLAMQSYYLRDEQLQELRALVQDPAVTATRENIKIEQIGRGETVSMLLRRLAMIGIILGIAIFGWWKFGPRSTPKFMALEFLGYEAGMIAENPQERLNLPSHDMKEIRQFIETYPGLEFRPRVLKEVPAPFAPEGASVIDYEIAKVATVAYTHPQTKERLIYFNYAGTLKELPWAEPGTIGGLVFQTYTSDDINIVAWEVNDGVVALLIGRRAAMELAQIALNGTRRD